MINVRPGYWDVDSCSWVGTDPVYVVPPLRHAEHPHDRAFGVPEIPAQQDDEVVLDPEEPVAT